VVAADALVDLLQDVLAFLLRDALHEYSGRCAPLVKLVSDEDVGLGAADELLGQVLVRGNLLLAEVSMKGCLQSTSIIMTSCPADGCARIVVGGAGSGMDGA
jgi:hypothetical protein